MTRHSDHDPKRQGPGEPSSSPSPSTHLDDVLLSAYVDGRAAHAEQAAAEGHLALCPACRLRLAELQALTSILRALPAPALRRSFQLGPEFAKSRRSGWERLASWLLPSLPALRAATVALALLLAAAGLRDVSDRDNGPVSDLAAPARTVLATVASTGDAASNVQSSQPQLAATRPPAAAPTFPTPTSAAKAEPAAEEAIESDLDDFNQTAGEPDDTAGARPVEDTGDATGGAARVADEADQPPDAAAGGDTGSSDTALAQTAADGDGTGSNEGDESQSIAAGEAEAAPEMAFVAVAEATPAASPSPAFAATQTPTTTATVTSTPSATSSPTSVFPSASPTPEAAPASTEEREDDRIDALRLAEIGLAVLLALSATAWLIVSRSSAYRVRKAARGGN